MQCRIYAQKLRWDVIVESENGVGGRSIEFGGFVDAYVKSVSGVQKLLHHLVYLVILMSVMPLLSGHNDTVLTNGSGLCLM